MQVLCVDGDARCLEQTLAVCRRMAERPLAAGFTRAAKALEWLEAHAADLALLEFNAADMSGVDLARAIRARCPDIAIVFLTDDRARAIDAWSLLPHVQGCLPKPVGPERLEEEIRHALSDRPRLHATPAEAGRAAPRRIQVKTFGCFDLFVDGRAVAFPRSKAKELLAYLVDRRGGVTSRREAFSKLWEDRFYDRPAQKYFDVVVRSLLRTLEANGVGEIVKKGRGTLCVRPEKLDCDFYRFLAGDIRTINAFRGEYMSDYYWASITEAFVGSLKNREH